MQRKILNERKSKDSSMRPLSPIADSGSGSSSRPRIATRWRMLLLFILIAYCVRAVWTGEMARGSLWFLVAWGSQFSTTLWHIGHIEHQFNFFTPSIMSMKEALTMPAGIVTVEQPRRVAADQPFEIRFES